MTTNQQHTPEPWQIERSAAPMSTQQQDYLITYSDGELRSHVARLFDNALCTEHGTTEANARRIVACVNACAGVDDAVLQPGSLRAAFLTMENAQTQRDELAAALRLIVAEIGPSYGLNDEPGSLNAATRIARAALAKAGIQS